MRSLRARLLLGAALGTALVLVVSAVVLHTLISRALRREFDSALAARMRALAVLVEQSEDGLEFEGLETPLVGFSADQPAEFYQLWTTDGVVFARSPSLRGGDLDRLAAAPGVAVFGDLMLPTGARGRVAAQVFAPRQDFEGRTPAPPMQVTLAVARPLTSLHDTLRHIRSVLVSVCVAAVAVSAGALAWVVRRGVRPIAQLSRQIAEMNAADLSARIAADGVPHELLPVIDRLNGLLTRLEAAFERERRFTGDVAHELRTPLAALRLRLELSLARDRQPADYRLALAECLDISLRTQRLVENLLHLARADAGQLDAEVEPVDVGQLIEECWDRVRERVVARGLRTSARIDASVCVHTDRELLRMAIQNVLDNAVTYANEGGECGISLQSHLETIELTVTNTGSKLADEDLTHVFDRFWRAETTAGSTGDHHGLGLSLAKTVIERLGGSMLASAPSDGVFCITVRLPTGARFVARCESEIRI